MRVLLDTSILFPALDSMHPHHTVCRRLLVEANNKEVVILNTHLIAELFRNLSGQPRLLVALDKVRESLHLLSRKYTCVELTTDDYLAAIDRCTELGLRGAVIYDALHFQAAVKANVNKLYTANIRDFARLMTDDVPFTIESPYR